jgi:hypothetical protein
VTISSPGLGGAVVGDELRLIPESPTSVASRLEALDLRAAGGVPELVLLDASVERLPHGPGVYYCAGDGTASPCPCANVGPPGRGCANSSGSGAWLESVGSASLAAADLRLQAIGAIQGQPGLVFQGDQRVAGGAGVPFGDGLRCAGGSVVRLQVLVPQAGGFAETSVDIGAEGGALPGEMKAFQFWYRDPTGGPCGSSFNLSNAIELTFAP